VDKGSNTSTGNEPAETDDAAPVETARSVVRLGCAAATAIPRAVIEHGRVALESFDFRGPEKMSRGNRVRLAAEALVDDALMAAFRLSVANRPPHVISKIAAEVDAATKVFDRHGWFDDPASYYEAPPPLREKDVDVVPDRLGRLKIERLTFASGYTPRADEPGIERWEHYKHNHTAHAWVLRHRGGDRPWLVINHGASMGWTLADLTVFRAARLHHDLQLNLVFPVMPFHGPRARRSPLTMQLPVEDPVDTVHAIAQSVWDTRRLITWIRGQSDQPIAVHGLSLGTFPASLVAAVEPDLASLTVGVPAVSLSDLYVHHLPARLRRRPEIIEFVEDSKDLLSVVSPLSVEPLVPRDRRFVYAASDDRVTDPVSQAHRLWVHWDRPEILWFRGGHVGVAWSSAVADFIRHGLTTAGLIEVDS
jgi:hypothetical protein